METRLNKGLLNYSEENKLGEGSDGNVYHGDYDGMSVAVSLNATICMNSSQRQIFENLYILLLETRTSDRSAEPMITKTMSNHSRYFSSLC